MCCGVNRFVVAGRLYRGGEREGCGVSRVGDVRVFLRVADESAGGGTNGKRGTGDLRPRGVELRHVVRGGVRDPYVAGAVSCDGNGASADGVRGVDHAVRQDAHDFVSRFMNASETAMKPSSR